MSKKTRAQAEEARLLAAEISKADTFSAAIPTQPQPLDIARCHDFDRDALETEFAP